MAYLYSGFRDKGISYFYIYTQNLQFKCVISTRFSNHLIIINKLLITDYIFINIVFKTF